jgi:drug/metabolite transporter (DMT)-like permease
LDYFLIIMLWLFYAILGPFLFGWANVIDNYLTNKIFKRTTTLLFYAGTVNILFLPIIFLITKPSFPPLYIIPLLLVIAPLDILYLFPYFKALQHEDTSTVSSLFSLGKIFVPVLAFFIIGEVLLTKQYFGFGLIILASALVTLERGAKIKFNRAFNYMMASSLVISFEAVLFKFSINEIGWGTTFFWVDVISILVMASFLLSKKERVEIKKKFKHMKKFAKIFVVEEIITTGGFLAVTFAFVFAPVTLVVAIGALQPFFVLLYAVLFSKRFPKFFKEKIDWKSLLKKSLFFALMIVGVYLVV